MSRTILILACLLLIGSGCSPDGERENQRINQLVEIAQQKQTIGEYFQIESSSVNKQWTNETHPDWVNVLTWKGSIVTDQKEILTPLNWIEIKNVIYLWVMISEKEKNEKRVHLRENFHSTVKLCLPGERKAYLFIGPFSKLALEATSDSNAETFHLCPPHWLNL